MKRQHLVIIYAVFGLSGFAALAYQVTWIRQLGSFFGIQVYSTTTVLAAFMAGLALGSWLFGRLADRVSRPLVLFAVMEIVLAAYAICFPWISDLISWLYLRLAPGTGGSLMVSQFVRFLVSFPILLVATSLIGGTLPVLTRGITHRSGELGEHVSLLYGSNNIGAFVGGFFSGYIFLSTIGISGALVSGAVLNFLNGIIVLLLRPKFHPGPVQRSGEQTLSDPPGAYPARVVRVVLWVFAIEGFTTLAYEIIWARIMNEFSYDKTSFFYTTIILAFVGGLGAGSYIVAKMIARKRDPLKLLSRVQLWIGALSLLMFGIFMLAAPAFHSFRDQQQTWFSTVVTEQFFIFLVITPPVVLMGFTFPLVSIIFNRSDRKIGQDIGFLGALDTIGSVAGSVIAAFVMIPLLGTLRSFLVVAMVNLLLGAWLLKFRIKTGMTLRIVTVAIVAIVGLVAMLPANNPSVNSRWNTVLNDEVIWYSEGPAASVGVTQFRNRNAALSINGAITAYTLLNDVQVHKMLATLPLVYCDKPERALVVGLGIGITTKTLEMAGVPEISVAEISPEVVSASENVFGNVSVKEDTSTVIYIEDGRAHLYRSKEKYDLITTNAVHPRLGNGIYTTDFYRLCSDRMQPGGKMCQWIPTNWMNKEEYRILVRSFCEVFPYSCLWVINDAHTIILGANEPFDHSVTRISERLSPAPLREYLGASGYLNVADVLKHFWMNDGAIRRYSEGAPLNTDNKPVIEFSRVVSRSPSKAVLIYLTDHMVPVTDVFSSDQRVEQVLKVMEIRQQQLENRLSTYIEQLDD